MPIVVAAAGGQVPLASRPCYRLSCASTKTGVTNFTGNGRMNYERLYGIAV